MKNGIFFAAIFFALVIMTGCAEPPVAPPGTKVDVDINFSTTIIQETPIVNPEVAPRFEIGGTILPFGTGFDTLYVNIGNGGGGTVDWSVAGLPTWLSTPNMSGTLNALQVSQIPFIVDRSQLSSGEERTGTFTINDFTVSVSVSKPAEDEVDAPRFEIGGTILPFGTGFDTLYVNIGNGGGGTVDWSVAGLPTWLSTPNMSGTLNAGDRKKVVFILDRESLDDGENTAHFYLNGIDVNTSATRLAPRFEIGGTILPFGTGFDTLYVNIGNGGGGTVDWSVAGLPTWLSTPNMSGTLNALQVSQIPFIVDRSQLSSGEERTGTFTINDFTVSVSVSKPAEDEVDAPRFEIGGTILPFGTGFDTLYVNIGNGGGGTVDWSVAGLPTWLSTPNMSGTLNAGDRKKVVFILDRESLDDGENTAHFYLNGIDVNTSATRLAPRFEIGGTILPFGTGFDTLYVNIGNGGGGTVDWSVAGLPTWLSTPNMSGTLNAGDRKKVVFILDRESLDDGENTAHFYLNGIDVNTSATRLAPRFEIGGTILPFGTGFDTLYVNIGNGGGGTVDWSVAGLPTWLSTPNMSGTLNALQVSQIPFIVDRSQLSSGEERTGTFTINDFTVSVSVSKPAEDEEENGGWHVMPTNDDTFVGAEEAYWMYNLGEHELLSTNESGWFKMKHEQIDGYGSKYQLDESGAWLFREVGTNDFAQILDPNLESVDIPDIGTVDVFVVVDFDEGWEGPRTPYIGTYFFEEGKQYEPILVHAAAFKSQMPSDWVHQNFSGSQSLKVSELFFKKID